MLFNFFVLTHGNFGGLRFRVFGVLGFWGLRFRGLRFRDTYYTRENVQCRTLQVVKIAVFNLKNDNTQHLRLKYVYFDVR